MHKGGGSPSCGGSRPHDAGQRFGLARSVPAARGEPARPGFPPEGETGKGAFRFLAAGESHHAACLWCPNGRAPPRTWG
jgi:hypothetical protein